MPIMGGRGDAPEQILPGANVLEFALKGSSKLIIRPSGTEPKIKVYLFAKGATAEESAQTLESLKAAAGQLLA
jgi:phosphoglucomutase